MRKMEPMRPLGTEGRRVWAQYAEDVSDHEALLVLCEWHDERQILRTRALKGKIGRVDVSRLEGGIAQLTEQVRRDASWTRTVVGQP